MSVFVRLRALCAIDPSSPFLRRKLVASCFSIVILQLINVSMTNGDLVESFDSVLGPATGEFAWDDFGLTGSPYAGPYAPDQYPVGVGTGALSVNPGGLIASTNNLYSFNSVATFVILLPFVEEGNRFNQFDLDASIPAPGNWELAFRPLPANILRFRHIENTGFSL